MGALWCYELCRPGQQFASATVLFAGEPEFGQITSVRLGGTLIQHVNLIGDTAESVATCFAFLINAGSNSVWAQADGATVSTAMAAYEAENPGRRPTEAGLQSSARGGPYLQSWPYNPAYYRYSINSRGVLELAIVKSSGSPVTLSAPTPYRGPQNCSFG